MHLGPGEIIVLVFVIVVVFSASRMAALGNAIGKFVYSFRKAAKGKDFIDLKRIPESRGKERSAPEDAAIVDDKKERL